MLLLKNPFNSDNWKEIELPDDKRYVDLLAAVGDVTVGDTVRHSPSLASRRLHSLVLVRLLVWLGHGHLEGVAAGGHHADAADGGDGRGEAHGGHAELTLPHVLHVSLGLQVDFVVEGDHDQDWQPESEAGRDDSVGVIHYEPALVRVAALPNKSVEININHLELENWSSLINQCK